MNDPDLQDQTPKATYKWLLHMNEEGPLDAEFRYFYLGDGTQMPLALSTAGLLVGDGVAVTTGNQGNFTAGQRIQVRKNILAGTGFEKFASAYVAEEEEGDTFLPLETICIVSSTATAVRLPLVDDGLVALPAGTATAVLWDGPGTLEVQGSFGLAPFVLEPGAIYCFEILAAASMSWALTRIIPMAGADYGGIQPASPTQVGVPARASEVVTRAGEFSVPAIVRRDVSATRQAVGSALVHETPQPILMISFIADDSPAADWTHFRPILANLSADVTALGLTAKSYAAVPGVVAAIANATDGVRVTSGGLTIEQAQHLQDVLGWEFASHSVAHDNYTTLSESAIRSDMLTAQARLRSYGLRCDHMVYPFGGNNELVRNVTSEMYHSGGSVSGTVAPMSVGVAPAYAYPRYGLGSFLAKDLDGTTNMSTLAQWQALVSRGLSNGVTTWIPVMLHSAVTDSAGWQLLIDFLEWVQTQPEYASGRIQFGTISDAWKMVGPVAQGGPGRTKARGERWVNPADSGITPYWALSPNGEFDLPNAGNILLLPLGTVSNSSPPSAFPRFRGTVMVFNTAEGTGKGFPGNAGTLITHRYHLDDGFCYQEMRVSVTASTMVYTRRWTGSEWTAWSENFGTGLRVKTRTTYSWTGQSSLASLASRNMDISVSSASPGTTTTVPGDLAIAVPARHIEATLAYRAYVFDTNTVRITLQNVSSGAVTPADRTWEIYVFSKLAI